MSMNWDENDEDVEVGFKTLVKVVIVYAILAAIVVYLISIGQ